MLRKFIAWLATIWQLSTYTLLAVPYVFYILPSFIFIGKSRFVFNVWLWFDIAIATVAHFTWKRTISGITGDRARTQLRYKYQEKVIDYLASLVGDKPNHCYRAFKQESRKKK